MPRRATRCGAAPVIGLPSTRHLAVARLHDAQHAADQRALPHSVAAHEPDGLAAPDSKVHPVQHVARAVVRVERAGLEDRVVHGRVPEGSATSPRYACRTARLARIAAGLAAFEHLAIHHHRDAVGDGEHRVHVVLDEQHRVVAREPLQAARPSVPPPPRPFRRAARRAAGLRARSRAPSRSRAGAVRRAKASPRCERRADAGPPRRAPAPQPRAPARTRVASVAIAQRVRMTRLRRQPAILEGGERRERCWSSGSCARCRFASAASGDRRVMSAPL